MLGALPLMLPAAWLELRARSASPWWGLALSQVLTCSPRR